MKKLFPVFLSSIKQTWKHDDKASVDNSNNSLLTILTPPDRMTQKQCLLVPDKWLIDQWTSRSSTLVILWTSKISKNILKGAFNMFQQTQSIQPGFFWRHKTGRFLWKQLTSLKWKENSTDAGDLRSIFHFISLRSERGMGLVGGWTLAFIIDPPGNCHLVHNGGSAKYYRLFWWKGKEILPQNTLEWLKETLWQPNGTSSKVLGI